MKTKKLPLVSIVTVNYNGKRFLKDCFVSLSGLRYPKNRMEIIMVDNCSSDGSVAYVRKYFPRVKVFKNNVNNYCMANNLGIAKSKGEYIAILNNDTRVDKNWLCELVDVIRTDDKIGAVCSKILFPNGKLQGTGHYEFPDFYWSDRGFKEKDRGQYNEIEEVKSLSHCSVLYRKECLESIGFLDEDFNMFMEDVDMSIRARQRGWRMVYAPGSLVYHKFHGSVNDIGFVSFYCERNRLLLVAKHYPQKLAPALFGKGYFTALRNRNELFKILPAVFTKLFKHHDKAVIFSVLPGIFEELDKILNKEKNYLVEQLDSLKNINSELYEKTIPQKDQLLQQSGAEIAQLKDAVNNNLALISQKDQLLQQSGAG
ncbi:MAG: glycosyltransferase family 2 protein, partial [Candidatus Omnitrophica bacterium]|nr:glycosyltransferase family 2 protein [Candidatus Omnitrophota bacterium]